MQLTDRDESIIHWVRELRFATQEQLQRLLFTPQGASACKRRLTVLYHNAYLDRRYLPIHSAFGSMRAVYCLDQRGAELLAYRQKTGQGLTWRPRDNNRELYFLEHTVAANDVRVAVTLASRANGFELVWTDERALRSRAMRDFVADPNHPDHKLAVIPDGHFRLTRNSSAHDFALELDRATVEERPFKEKVRALGEWKATGVYRRRFGSDSLRVLFVVAATKRDPGRLARIKRWTEAEGGMSLFWFTDITALSRSSLLSEPIWHVAGRAPLFALFDRQ